MAKKPTGPSRVLVFADQAADIPNAQVQWQPVWCATHHFETVAKGLSKCPYGCPPGPSVRTLHNSAFEILSGGSRGGMKTETTRGWLLKGNIGEPIDHANGHNVIGHGATAYCGQCVNSSYIAHPLYRALILRENEKDLADYLSRARMLYEPMGASVTEKPARVIWPAPFATSSPGATFILGHMRDANAYTDYMGQEFQRMIFEELTQIPKELLYLQITGSCRSTFICRKGCKPGECMCGVLRRQVLNTTNPGNKGHLWVKKRFISIGKPNEIHKDPLTKQTRAYIPSLVTDNPYLMQDEGYLAWLDGLPEPTRSAWRYGDWDALGGQYFRDFRPKGPLAGPPPEPPEARHVIKRGERTLQPWWPRWIGGDWGYGHLSAVYAACKDPNGQTIVYREIITKEVGAVELGDMIGRTFLPELDGLSRANVTPSITFWLSPDAFDKRDAELTIAEHIGSGVQRVLGPNSVHFPDLWKNNGPAVNEWDAERFREIDLQQKAGIVIRRAHNPRVAGWQHIRELLRFRQIAQPNPETYKYEYYCELMREDPVRAAQYAKGFEARKPEVLPKLLIVEEDCPGIIDAIPTAVHEEGTEDVLKTDSPEDDKLDGFRYCLHSQNQSQNREPKQSFVERHIERHGAALTYNDKVFMALKATEDYEAADEDMRPFRLRAASSHQLQ